LIYHLFFYLLLAEEKGGGNGRWERKEGTRGGKGRREREVGTEGGRYPAACDEEEALAPVLCEEIDANMLYSQEVRMCSHTIECVLLLKRLMQICCIRKRFAHAVSYDRSCIRQVFCHHT